MNPLFRLTYFCALASSLTISNAHSQQTPAPVVHTEGGLLQGSAELGVFSFKRIPYSAPPVGDLRWRPPNPASPWQDTRTATSYGNACMQTPGLSEANGGAPGRLSEDCLYLNVWTPDFSPGAKLPVIFWIHGGAYIFGSGSLALYNGGPLAAKGAVVITINYRLAQLGFFAHPALEKESPGGPANFGLLDQIAALQWVQRNVAQFGGDPANVTIIGQSAGAKSVLALFASPLARGLFARGVALSSYAVPDVTRAKALDTGTKVATALGLPGADATAADLRAIPAEKFAQLNPQEFFTGPVPIAADPVLPQSVQDTFAAGREAPLPLILGSTSDDSSVVAAFGVDPAALLKRVRGAGLLAKVLYPGVKDDSQLGRQVARDLVFTMPARWIADRHSKLAPTWRYYFNYTAERQRTKFPDGVAHGGEIVYFLDTAGVDPNYSAIFTAQDREFAELVSEYLLQFARTGSPHAQGGPTWLPHNSRQDRTLLFADATSLQSNFMRPRLNFFITLIKLLGPFLSRN
jgi:para-nitrobenzyl esterase